MLEHNPRGHTIIGEFEAYGDSVLFHTLGAQIQAMQTRGQRGISSWLFGHTAARLLLDWQYLSQINEYGSLHRFWAVWLPYRYGALAAIRPGQTKQPNQDNPLGLYFCFDLVEHNTIVPALGAEVRPAVGTGDDLLFFHVPTVPDLRKVCRACHVSMEDIQLVRDLAQLYGLFNGTEITAMATCPSGEHAKLAVDAELHFWHRDAQDMFEFLQNPMDRPTWMDQFRFCFSNTYGCVAQASKKVEYFNMAESLSNAVRERGIGLRIASQVADNFRPGSMTDELRLRQDLVLLLEGFMEYARKLLEKAGISDLVKEETRRKHRDAETRLLNIATVQWLREGEMVASERRGSSTLRSVGLKLQELNGRLLQSLDRSLPSRWDPTFFEQF